MAVWEQDEWGWGRRISAMLPAFPPHTAWQSETLSSMERAPQLSLSWQTSKVGTVWMPNCWIRLMQAKNAVATRWHPQSASSTSVWDWVSQRISSYWLNMLVLNLFERYRQGTLMVQGLLASPRRNHVPAQCFCGWTCCDSPTCTGQQRLCPSCTGWTNITCPAHPVSKEWELMSWHNKNTHTKQSFDFNVYQTLRRPVGLQTNGTGMPIAWAAKGHSGYQAQSDSK